MERPAERPVNNSDMLAAAFCTALDAGARVTKVAAPFAVATGLNGGAELVRHVDTLGLVRPIDVVDAQGNCIVELKKAEVGAKTPDGQIRAIAGRNFTLSAAGRTYPAESDNTGKLIATSSSGGKTDTFKFEGNSSNGELPILTTDTEAADPSKATKISNVDCNVKTELKIVFEAPPSNATPGTANIAKPNEGMVTKPANTAPATPKPESKPTMPPAQPTTAPAKPEIPPAVVAALQTPSGPRAFWENFKNVGKSIGDELPDIVWRTALIGGGIYLVRTGLSSFRARRFQLASGGALVSSLGFGLGATALGYWLDYWD